MLFVFRHFKKVENHRLKLSKTEIILSEKFKYLQKCIFSDKNIFPFLREQKQNIIEILKHE
jgi:hypothetical protein